MSYAPRVYREQGGDRMVVQSSGEIDLSSAGAILRHYIEQPLSLITAREISGANIASGGSASGLLFGGLLSFETSPSLQRTASGTDHALRLAWASANNDEVQFDPLWLSSALDSSYSPVVKIVAEKASGTNTSAEFRAHLWSGVGDSSVSATFGALTSSPAVYSAAYPASNLAAGPAMLNVTIAPASHAQDAVHLYGIAVRYRTKE